MAASDQAVKTLLQGRHDDIARAVIPELSELRQISSEPVIPAQRITDTVYEAMLFLVAVIVNIEIQLNGDKEMGWRTQIYAARLMSIFEKPVLTIVLWLEDKGVIPPSDYRVMAGPYELGGQKMYHLRVFEMDATKIVQEGPLGLLPLTPFMRNATEEMLVQAGLRIEAEAPQETKNDLESVLALFASRKHGDAFGTILLERITNMDTSFSQNFPLYHKFRNEGFAEGKAVGIVEGEAKGEAQGLRESFELLWQVRFGTPPERLLEKIDSLDTPALKAIIRQMATASEEQIREQLTTP